MRVTFVVCSPSEVFETTPAQAFSIHQRYPPMGLLSVATSVAQDHEVQVIDQNVEGISDVALLRQLDESGVSVVGFSCTSLNIGRTVELCRVLRKRPAPPYLVAGGIHPTLCPEDTLEEGVFDGIVIGEGEHVMRAVCYALQRQEFSHIDIEGFWSHGGSSGGTAVLANLDSVEVDRRFIAGKPYDESGSLVGPGATRTIVQSRGCPFSCNFCCKPEHGRRYRLRSIENVLNEIEFLVKYEEVRTLVFREDNFSANEQRVRDLCRGLQQRFGSSLTWECESRADIDLFLLDEMFEAGCRGVWCGLETMNPRWQRWLGKILDPGKVSTFYAHCQEMGINTGALFLLGFPEQTPDELGKDIEFARSLPVAWRYFQTLAQFPGQTLDKSLWGDNPPQPITKHVSLFCLPGHTVQEMIELEARINNDISVRKTL